MTPTQKLIEAAEAAIEALAVGRDYAEGEQFENAQRYKGHEHLAPNDAECIAQIDAAIAALRTALQGLREAQAANIGPDWRPCVKLPITVHVREQRPGERYVSTREGITPLKADDLIMRGVAGEEYPIGRELFARTYRMGEATPPTTDAPAQGVA